MTNGFLRLSRRDILDMEQRLHEGLSRVLRFSGHAVYFPQEDIPPGAVWIADERTVLVPLVQPADRDGERPEVLGVFAARDADRPGEDLLALLPEIASICLENLALFKAGQLDPVTGLAVRRVLEDRISREIQAIQSAFSGGDESPAGGAFAVAAFRLAPLRHVAREYGQPFAEAFGKALAEALLAEVPEGGLATRSGDSGFAVFLPATGRTGCEKVMIGMLRAMDAVRLTTPISRQELGLAVQGGYALFPQDMDGLLAAREPLEQAQRLLQRAALAASVAAVADDSHRFLGYGRILTEGGTVLRPLPLSRLVVSLGRNVGAREGQRFAVHARPVDGQAPVYKGEISLVRVHRDEAEAEIVVLGDPAEPPTPGDTLQLLPESVDVIPGSGSDAVRDKATGLLRHGDFLSRLAPAQDGCERFSLVLLDVENRNGTDPDAVLADAARRIRERFTPGDEADNHFGGRYGQHSVMLFHRDVEPDALLRDYAALAEALSREVGCRVGAGIASWPFLQFRKAEVPDCARKALEYALLLPPPHVGLFGSLALNISADKRHLVGDVFGAVEEYKLALLADEHNALAWNSLGVCMASLGRPAEARRYFEEALARNADDAALAYNLGAVCLDLGDVQAAENYFGKCLGLDPGHLYAHVRLGQAAERRGDPKEARRHYEAASRLEESALPFRHLARLCLREGSLSEAREHLHQALRRNPRDAVALQLMAGLYLDGGEDPALAESLARNSVALHPERKNGWLVLARALEVQGKDVESRQARLRAAEL